MQAFSQSLDTASMAAELAKTYDLYVPSARARRNSPTAAYHITSTMRARILYKFYKPTASLASHKAPTTASTPVAGSSKGSLNAVVSQAVKKEEDLEDDTRLLDAAAAVHLVKKEESQSENDRPEEYAITTAKWNLPSWAGDGEWAYPVARAESICNKPPTLEWNGVKRTGRCVIVCDGYFATSIKVRNKKRVESACFVRHSDSRLMMLAGLFYYNKDDVIPLRFCAISAEKVAYTLKKIGSLKKEVQKPEGGSGKKKGKGKKAAANIPPGYLSKKLKMPGNRVPVILSTPGEVKIWLDTSSRSFEDKHKQLLSPRIDQNAPLIWYKVEEGEYSCDPAWVEPAHDPDQGVECESSGSDNEDSQNDTL